MQFERRGYYRIDKITKEGDNFSYNLIFVPDGKAVGLASMAKQTDKKLREYGCSVSGFDIDDSKNEVAAAEGIDIRPGFTDKKYNILAFTFFNFAQRTTLY